MLYSEYYCQPVRSDWQTSGSFYGYSSCFKNTKLRTKIRVTKRYSVLYRFQAVINTDKTPQINTDCKQPAIVKF